MCDIDVLNPLIDDIEPKDDPDLFVEKSYPMRWRILGMFCFLNFANATLWVTFAPISDITQHYFTSSSTSSNAQWVGGITAVNILATVFQILFGPGTLMAVICMKRIGLKYTLLLGGSLSIIGAGIRLVSGLVRENVSDNLAYSLILLGQCFAALSQPVYVNMPAVISSVWFPSNERDIATTIASLFNPLGNAIGQVLPVLFVSESSTSGYDQICSNYSCVQGMTNLFGTEFCLCLLPFILAYVWFESSPPTAPSLSMKLKSDVSNKADVDDNREWTQTLVEVRSLLGNRDYRILLISFSIGIGIFNTIMTLINQLTATQGYSNDDAGTFGAVLVVCGLVGAAITGHLMERTKAYRTILKVGFGCSLCGVIFMLSMLYPDNGDLLLFSFCILGFFILPMLPAVLENCAECTYPVSEELSVGLLFLGGNTIGIGFTFALQTLLSLSPSSWGNLDGYYNPLTPYGLFLVGVTAVAFTTLLFYNGQYKRLETEQQR